MWELRTLSPGEKWDIAASVTLYPTISSSKEYYCKTTIQPSTHNTTGILFPIGIEPLLFMLSSCDLLCEGGSEDGGGGGVWHLPGGGAEGGVPGARRMSLHGHWQVPAHSPLHWLRLAHVSDHAVWPRDLVTSWPDSLLLRFSFAASLDRSIASFSTSNNYVYEYQVWYKTLINLCLEKYHFFCNSLWHLNILNTNNWEGWSFIKH